MQKTKPKSSSVYPLLLIYSLFFMWGFIWNLFNVLATFFQESFELSNLQTSLGTSLSFLAFFLMSYPAKIIINRLGTKKAISLGAFITAIGLAIFFPALWSYSLGSSWYHSYSRDERDFQTELPVL